MKRDGLDGGNRKSRLSGAEIGMGPELGLQESCQKNHSHSTSPPNPPLEAYTTRITPPTTLSTPPNYNMASKHASRALRASLRQASTPRVQQRTFVSAVNAATRPTVQKVAPAPFVQQARGAKTVDFAGDKEKVFGGV